MIFLSLIDDKLLVTDDTTVILLHISLVKGDAEFQLVGNINIPNE